MFSTNPDRLHRPPSTRCRTGKWHFARHSDQNGPQRSSLTGTRCNGARMDIDSARVVSLSAGPFCDARIRAALSPMTPHGGDDGRMGALPPKYSFLLNPHPHERFSRCPRCKATTRVRKIVLVIHRDPIGLVLLRKTCRLCVVCEVLIAHEEEVNRLINALPADPPAVSPYLVLGTIDLKTWREVMSGTVAIKQVRDHMADFKAYMRVDITPRHWARSD